MGILVFNINVFIITHHRWQRRPFDTKDSKEVLRITGVLDFSIVQDSRKYKRTQHIGNWICFCPQMGDTYSDGSVRKS
jgi:hypothetical protein